VTSCGVTHGEASLWYHFSINKVSLLYGEVSLLYGGFGFTLYIEERVQAYYIGIGVSLWFHSCMDKVSLLYGGGFTFVWRLWFHFVYRKRVKEQFHFCFAFVWGGFGYTLYEGFGYTLCKEKKSIRDRGFTLVSLLYGRGFTFHMQALCVYVEVSLLYGGLGFTLYYKKKEYKRSRFHFGSAFVWRGSTFVWRFHFL